MKIQLGRLKDLRLNMAQRGLDFGILDQLLGPGTEEIIQTDPAIFETHRSAVHADKK